ASPFDVVQAVAHGLRPTRRIVTRPSTHTANVAVALDWTSSSQSRSADLSSDGRYASSEGHRDGRSCANGLTPRPYAVAYLLALALPNSKAGVSSIRLAGCPCKLARMSASQACGSMSFYILYLKFVPASLPVPDGTLQRRAMPAEQSRNDLQTITS